jgi:hypothetical protein
MMGILMSIMDRIVAVLLVVFNFVQSFMSVVGLINDKELFERSQDSFEHKGAVVN